MNLRFINNLMKNSILFQKGEKVKKTPRKAASKASTKNRAMISSGDVMQEGKQENKITDHFKV